MPIRRETEIQIPKDLIEIIRKGECVLFVASGLSTKVVRKNRKRLPGWKDFLLELLAWCQQNRVTFNSEPEEIDEMIQKGNYLMAAQELQEIISNNEFSEFLNSVFRDVKVKPTNNHISLTKIPFRAILTTNYDTLIEGAYALSNDGRLPNKYTQNDLSAALSPLRKKEFFIFKMHGDIDRVETIILGNRSYNSLLHKSPEYLSFLEILFTTQTVLFVGFGGSDPDLDYVIDKLSTVFSRTLNKHYLLAPSKKFNFTEKRRLLIDKRLEVLEYDASDNHKGFDDFIENLANIFRDFRQDSELIQKYNVLIISGEYDFRTYMDKIEKYFTGNQFISVSGWANMSYYFNLNSRKTANDLLRKDLEIEEPNIILLLITEKGLNSERFEIDLEFALLRELEDKISIIPIIIGDVEIPYKLRSKRYLRLNPEFTSKDLKELESLIRNS